MRILSVVLALFLLAVAQSATAAETGKADFIVVEKAKRTLTLIRKGKVLKTYRIALGGNPVGHKQQEGDSRTPEGRYIIDARNARSSFHKSLHISYPDAKDRASARRRKVSPGGAIMIHGTPEYLGALPPALMPDWTAGCIAVRNAEMDEIFRLVPIGARILIKP